MMHVISAHVCKLRDSCLLAQGILRSESSFLCTMMHTRSSKSPLMSGDDHPQKAGKAHWAVEEEAMLIQFLSDKASPSPTRTSFKTQDFTEAAKCLKRYPSRKGGVKTNKLCQNKLQSICISFVHVLSCILTCMTS